MKRAISLFKRMGKAYFRNLGEMYKPMLDAGVSPWI
jgi:hypothetical protein